jgi:RNA polymerase sigma-70 factor (ECF subfamily)
MAFLQGVIPKTFLGDDQQIAVVNGQAGIVIIQDGKPRSVISFQLDESRQRAQRIFVMLNPDKLKHVQPD